MSQFPEVRQNALLQIAQRLSYRQLGVLAVEVDETREGLDETTGRLSAGREARDRMNFNTLGLLQPAGGGVLDGPWSKLGEVVNGAVSTTLMSLSDIAREERSAMADLLWWSS